MTETGLSLGTPHYMSPEQATAEKEITARSDIYSLASVLYEMLTGSPPHVGASAQQIVAKIVTEEAAPVTTLRKAVPPNVAAAVAKALEKLPADRFHSGAAFAQALGDPSFRLQTPGPTFGRSRLTLRDRLRDPVLQTVGAVALSALAGVAWLGVRPPTPPAPSPVQFVLTSATARPVMTNTWPALVSPDGRHIVYAGEAGGGQHQLYVRRVDRLEARPLPGTVGALQPIFSPDGRWVAFETGGQLLKVPVDGGTVVPIVAAGGGNGAAWTSRGEIILGSETGAIPGLARVSDAGGKLTPLTTTGDSTGVTLHLWPIVLEDGHTILMTVLRGNPAPGKSNDAYQLAMTSLDDGIVHPLRAAGVRALGVVGGRLIYLQADGTVMAVPFDARRKQLTGTPPAPRLDPAVR
jgi:serine/threonine-protein kinase